MVNKVKLKDNGMERDIKRIVVAGGMFQATVMILLSAPLLLRFVERGAFKMVAGWGEGGYAGVHHRMSRGRRRSQHSERLNATSY